METASKTGGSTTTESRLVELDDSPGLRFDRMLHFIWLGPKTLPDKHRRYIDSWRQHHPHWQLRLWRDADLPELRHRELFDRATTWAGKSDILRYELVDRFGGVYVDTDIQCLRPIDDLLTGCASFIAREHPGGRISNGIFGGAPGNPFIREVLDLLPRRFHPRSPHRTGPTLFTEVGRRHGETRIFEAQIFSPLTPEELFERRRAGTLKGVDFSRAYAVHWYAGSWLPKKPILGDRLRILVSKTLRKWQR